MIEKTFQVGSTPDVAVRIQAGRIELVTSPDGTVKVTVVTKDPDFIVEQRGDLIEVYSEGEAKWITSKRADVRLEVPTGTNAAIKCTSAEIEASVVLGKVEIKSASGDIDLAGAAKVIIKTASGDTTLGPIEDALRFSSASGDLRVRKRANGSVVASTASGDVHIDDSDAVLEINTVSGDAIVDRYTGKSASLKTMSGSVELGIPAGTKVDLDVSLLSGKVHLPHKTTEPVATERHTSLKVKSVSGDLTINRVT